MEFLSEWTVTFSFKYSKSTFSNFLDKRTVSLRFLGIILRFLRLEVSRWISYGKKVWFSIRFSFLSPLQSTATELKKLKTLREFEEIEISKQSFRGHCEYTFVWIDFVQEFGLS
jgi:hypothetical protein